MTEVHGKQDAILTILTFYIKLQGKKTAAEKDELQHHWGGQVFRIALAAIFRYCSPPLHRSNAAGHSKEHDGSMERAIPYFQTAL